MFDWPLLSILLLILGSLALAVALWIAVYAMFGTKANKRPLRSGTQVGKFSLSHKREGGRP